MSFVEEVRNPSDAHTVENEQISSFNIVCKQGHEEEFDKIVERLMAEAPGQYELKLHRFNRGVGKFDAVLIYGIKPTPKS